MTSLSLVDEAIAIGTVAVAAEKGGRAQEAIEKYTEACGLFIRAVQLELHPQRQSLLKAQATDFLQRAERLKSGANSGGGGGIESRGNRVGGSSTSVAIGNDAEDSEDDPLVLEGRRFEAEAVACEAAAVDFARAKQLHTRAIERFLAALKLEQPGTARAGCLKREAGLAIARAERVGAVLVAREKDAARQPYERARQLEAHALEAQQRGETDRAFQLYSKAIEIAFSLHPSSSSSPSVDSSSSSTPPPPPPLASFLVDLWSHEAAPLAERCVGACEQLKKTMILQQQQQQQQQQEGRKMGGGGIGSGGGGGGVNDDNDDDEVNLARAKAKAAAAATGAGWGGGHGIGSSGGGLLSEELVEACLVDSSSGGGGAAAITPKGDAAAFHSSSSSSSFVRYPPSLAAPFAAQDLRPAMETRARMMAAAASATSAAAAAAAGGAAGAAVGASMPWDPLCIVNMSMGCGGGGGTGSGGGGGGGQEADRRVLLVGARLPSRHRRRPRSSIGSSSSSSSSSSCSGAGGGGGGDSGDGFESSSSSSPSFDRGLGCSVLVRNLCAAKDAQPHRECGVEHVLLRTTTTATTNTTSTTKEDEQVLFEDLEDELFNDDDENGRCDGKDNTSIMAAAANAASVSITAAAAVEAALAAAAGGESSSSLESISEFEVQDEVLFVLGAPPLGTSVPLVEWLAGVGPREAKVVVGASSGASADASASAAAAASPTATYVIRRGGMGRLRRPGFEACRSVFRQLLQELQLLHAAKVFGSLGRVDGGGPWVCGLPPAITSGGGGSSGGGMSDGSSGGGGDGGEGLSSVGGSAYVLLPGLASLDPTGAFDLSYDVTTTTTRAAAVTATAVSKRGRGIKTRKSSEAVLGPSPLLPHVIDKDRSIDASMGGDGRAAAKRVEEEEEEEEEAAAAAWLAAEERVQEAKRVYRSTVAPELLESSNGSGGGVGSSGGGGGGGEEEGASGLPAYTASTDLYQWAALAFWAFTGKDWAAHVAATTAAAAAAAAGSGGGGGGAASGCGGGCGGSTLVVMPPPPASLPLSFELWDLLEACLTTGALNKSRPSCRDALRHPFFTLPVQVSGGGSGGGGGSGCTGCSGGSGGGGVGGSSSSHNNSSSSSSALEDELESQDRVVALQQVCSLLRESHSSKGRFFVTVQRSAIVDTVISAFALCSKAKLLRPLSVKFLGEDGIDAGGLTKEMYASFFSSLTSGKCPLFVCDADAEKPLFLPAKEDEAESAMEEDPLSLSFLAVGRVLGKAVLDGVPIAASFHPLLFRALLQGRGGNGGGASSSSSGTTSRSSSSSLASSLSVNLHDLEAFSPQDAKSCRQLLAMPDVSCLYLSFEECDGGNDVTDSNVKHYVRRRAHHELLGLRTRRLESLRRGFSDVPLGAHLRLFSVFELMTLVCGKATCSAPDLLERLRFVGFSKHSSTPNALRQVLRAFTDQQRLKFVSFVTASAALPPLMSNAASNREEDEEAEEGGRASSSSSGMITIQRVAWDRARFPLAHTCFDRLDLPDYGDEGTVQQRLVWCLDNLEMAGFGES